MAIQKLAVIGAGTMGRGIAECAATRGLNVAVVEVLPQQRQAARERIAASLDKVAKRGKLAETPQQIAGRLDWPETLDAAADCELVIEAVTEDQSVKRKLFEDLDRLCPPQSILASNTSSISLTRIGSWTSRPERVVGLHFFNPVPIMPPVEIVTGLKTSAETVDAAKAIAVQLGKQPFVVQDSPGFVVNRVLMPLINEAVFALQEGIADAATIDSLMKLGCNHPMGPLELADLIGLDVCLAILRVLFAETGDPKFRPCPLLVRMVDAGKLGRKSGGGFVG